MSNFSKEFIASQIQLVSEAEGCKSVSQLAKRLGMPYQTLLNYARADREPKWELVRYMHLFGIDAGWFVTGEGEMYRPGFGDGREIKEETPIPYGAKSGNSSADNLCQWLRYYANTHTPQDMGWLEREIARLEPDYLMWAAEQGIEVTKATKYDRALSLLRPLLDSMDEESLQRMKPVLDELKQQNPKGE